MALEIFRLVGSVFVDTDKADKSLQKTDKKAGAFGKTLVAGAKAAGKLAVGVGTMAVAAVGGLIAYGMYAKSLSEQIQTLRREMKVTQMQAPGSKQTYRLQLVGSEPSQPTLALGWMQPPQLIELVLDATEERYNQFQITIDKVDGGRVMQMRRLARDSNKQVRFALNSSAFGPGDFVLRVEGYTWRGQLEPVGWARLGLQ